MHPFLWRESSAHSGDDLMTSLGHQYLYTYIHYKHYTAWALVTYLQFFLQKGQLTEDQWHHAWRHNRKTATSNYPITIVS